MILDALLSTLTARPCGGGGTPRLLVGLGSKYATEPSVGSVFGVRPGRGRHMDFCCAKLPDVAKGQWKLLGPVATDRSGGLAELVTRAGPFCFLDTTFSPTRQV